MRKKAAVFQKIADIHCHILPGLDDGATDMEETLEMLAMAWEEGIHHIIATPHYKTDRRNAGGGTIRQKLSEVEREAKSRGIGVKLYPGQEILYFRGMEETLETGQLMTMNETAYVLVEFMPTDDYIYIRNALDGIRGMGYFPIAAHVERYECMIKHPELAEELHSMGIGMQINAASVTGEAGRGCRVFAHKLLKRQIVDYVSTDAHRRRGRTPDFRRCAEILFKTYDSSYVKAVIYDNAMTKLLGGESGCRTLS